jgi:hypothetical protein
VCSFRVLAMRLLTILIDNSVDVNVLTNYPEIYMYIAKEHKSFPDQFRVEKNY